MVVNEICTPGGSRLRPSADALKKFCEKCESLNSECVSKELGKKLQAKDWQTKLKALYAIESLADFELNGITGNISLEYSAELRKTHALPPCRDEAEKVLVLLKLEIPASPPACPEQQQEEQVSLGPARGMHTLARGMHTLEGMRTYYIVRDASESTGRARPGEHPLYFAHGLSLDWTIGQGQPQKVGYVEIPRHLLDSVGQTGCSVWLNICRNNLLDPCRESRLKLRLTVPVAADAIHDASTGGWLRPLTDQEEEKVTRGVGWKEINITNLLEKGYQRGLDEVSSDRCAIELMPVEGDHLRFDGSSFKTNTGRKEYTSPHQVGFILK